MSDPVRSEIDLPRLYRAEITLDDLAAICRDIERCASITAVAVKSGARRMAEGCGEVTLAEALAQVGAGTARGIQIDYDYDGGHWLDTVMIRTDGLMEITRLCRLEEPPS